MPQPGDLFDIAEGELCKIAGSKEGGQNELPMKYLIFDADQSYGIGLL